MADTEKDKLKSLMQRIKARKRHEDNKVRQVAEAAKIVEQELEK